jgi:hypothetical protein
VALADVLKIQQARLDAMSMSAKRDMLEALTRARDEILGRMPRTAGRYTLDAHWTMLAQVEASMARLSRDLGGVLGKAKEDALDRSAKDASAKVKAMAQEFRGAEDVALPVPEAQKIVDRQTILRAVEADRARRGAAIYGLQTVGDIERELATSLLTGESTQAAVERLQRAKVWPDAAWKAERIVRTEISHAYNAGTRASLDAVAETRPDLWLMWHEHAQGPTWGGPKSKPWRGPARPLDDRVGDDSLRLHGQLRRPGQPFTDPKTGRQYAHPPNRPHDRATLILVRADKTGRIAA